MTTEIFFQGLGRSASGHNSENGEMAALVGAVAEGGALTPLGALQWRHQMPAGCKAIGIHHTPEGDNCIIIKTLSQAAASVCWMRIGTDEPQPALTVVASIDGPCSGMAAVGSYVSLATASGLKHMRWTGSEYLWLDSGPEMPIIEFGIEKAGSLDLATAYRVPASLAPLPSSGSGVPGSGAWQTHPEGHQAEQDCSSAINLISADIRSAIERQIESKGMWHQPFLVRYALRLADGTSTLPSPPVLMLPTVLPPCISVGSVEATDKEDVNLLHLDASTCSYFRLKRRVVTGLDAKWAPLVLGVDIYATAQIPTYLADSSGCSGIVSFASLAGCANTSSSASADRGRPTRADSDTFLGHFSDSGSNFRDYSVGDCGLADTRAWDLAPDPALRHNIMAADSYHLIASIPFADLVAESDFTDVDVATTKAAAIKAQPTLQCQWQSHFRHLPSVVYSFNRRLLFGAGSMRAPRPLHPRCTFAASGLASSSSTTEVAILTTHGVEVCSSAQFTGSPVVGEGAFPRYAHVADANAYALLLRQGSNYWRLPLRPHPAIGGACWLGSLAADNESLCRITAAQYREATATADALIAEHSAVYTTEAHNPMAVSDKTYVGDGRVIALQAALQPMSQGQFGQFPLYAFATDGIWALTATTGGYVTRQPVTRDVCYSPEAIAPTDRGVAFVSQRGVMLVSGAKCECLSTGLNSAMAARLATLPQIGNICRPAALPSLRAITNEGPCLSYDSANSRLWAYAYGGGGMAMVHSMQSGHWAMSAAAIAAPVQGEWVQDRSGRLAPLSATDTAVRTVSLVTRPIKTRRPAQAAPLSAVRLTGRAAPASVKMIVYGSNDLQHWHIAATSRTSEARALAGTPYRYHIIAATATLSHLEDLCGALLT